jgi:hypothetical protein
MAFARTGLARNSSGLGDNPTIWSYTSADTAATVTGADYFLEAITEMEVGDQVVIYDTAGVMTISFVKTNTGTAITLASGTAIGDV